MKRFLSVLLLSLFAAVTMAGTEVYTPTLKAPANNIANQMPNVTLSWNAIVGSTGLQYEIQLDTSQNFNSAVKTDTTLHLLAGYTAHGLYFGKKYFWRVRAIDLGQTSAWSAPWIFTVFSHVHPTFPLLNPPAKTKDTIGPKQVLVWSKQDTVTLGPPPVMITISGIKFYDIQCDTTRNFNSTQLISGTVSSTLNYFWVSNLRFGIKYYWRVRARHDLDSSPWSTVFYFTVTNHTMPTSPANKATDQFLNTTLLWSSIKGVLGYEYQLALDSNFTNLVSASGVDTNFVASQFTRFGTKYYWRSRARTISDTSNWSSIFSFTTIDLVKITTPSNNATNIALKPTMKWTKQTGIVKYQLQVDVTSDFSSSPLFTDVRLADTLTSFILTKTLKNFTVYYWRMRAYSDSQMPDTSGWSSVFSFKTLSTGIDENSGITSSIYPNPASGMVNLKIVADEPGALQVSVINLLGSSFINEAYELTSGINNHELNISNLSKGVYIVRLNFGSNVTNHKLIVDR